MKYYVLAAAALLAVGSIGLGDLSTEQAQEKLRDRQQQRLAASTQPATHEEISDLWIEINKLKNEVQGLREQVTDLREQLAFREGKTKVDPHQSGAPAPGRKPVRRPETVDPAAQN